MFTATTCTEASAAGFAFRLTPEAPALPAPRTKPILRNVYYLAVSRRSEAEIVAIPFRSVESASNYAKGVRSDPDVVAVEILQLARQRAGARAATPVSTRVNRPRNDDPQYVEPVAC